jgi:ABC-2 type transport system permease protein
VQAPLSAAELLIGFALGGVTRGLVVGSLTLLAISPFVTIPLPHPGAALFYALGGAFLFSMLGIVAGLWARRMDEQGAVTSFIIAPLTLLSGTFFAVNALPPTFRQIALLDPFFYIVDGFRHGVAGVSETHHAIGTLVVVGANLLLGLLCHRLLASGWRLRQ